MNLIGETEKTKAIPEIPSSVTRLEVIDEFGRIYVRDPRVHGPIQVELSYQDGGRTLKVFVQSRGKEAEDEVRKQMADGMQRFIDALARNWTLTKREA